MAALSGNEMKICLVVSLMISLAMGTVHGRKNVSAEYLSVEELYRVCLAPGDCGKKMVCEGQVARVKGYIDYDHVFDKSHYPQLPYEKFRIHDMKGEAIEVWVQAGEDKEIFQGIYENKLSGEGLAFVKGRLIGFDMPMMGRCRRSLSISLEKASDIFFR